jgi:hypothetical protein
MLRSKKDALSMTVPHVSMSISSKYPDHVPFSIPSMSLALFDIFVGCMRCHVAFFKPVLEHDRG